MTGDTAGTALAGALSTATGAAATAGTHGILQGTLAATALGYSLVYGNGTLTVNKAALTATADDKTKTYGASEPSLSYTVGGSLFYGDAASVVSGVSLSTTTAAAATAGTHAINASGGTASNYTVTPVNGTLSVGKAALTVFVNDKSKVYGDADPLLTASAGAGQLKYSDTLATVSGLTQSTATGASATAGTHVIAAAGGSAANYNVTSVNGTLSVAKAALSITADNKSKTYGDPDPLLSYSGAPLQLKYSDSLAVVTGVALSAATGSAATAGTHVITASGGTAQNYTVNAVNAVNGTLSVVPASAVGAAIGGSRTVGTQNPPFRVDISGLRYGESAALLGGSLQYATSATTASDVGNYPVQPFGYSAVNYAFTYVPGILAVSGTGTPAVLTDAINLGPLAQISSLGSAVLGNEFVFATSFLQVSFPSAGGGRPTVMRANCGGQPMGVLNCTSR